MTLGNRPLSPHLQVYRPQITSVLSITHRMTGLGLSVGALALTYWLNAAAYGADAFGRAQAILGSGIGIILLIAWTFALFFHLCNGIRHLFWDTGRGFEMSTLRVTGWVVILASLALTAGTWVLVLGI
ncbi:MAG: succinate dehydrogenase, cytochrome b556 subunit [Rhodospirillales bacterium]|nr:succinate dehydrogenase, cytochrome b556 subunit [Rhodospirillales bacterium]